MKQSGLYDAEDSEDKVTTEHSEGHSPQTPLKESDVYDAEGSEDEVAPKHISKPKVRSLSERKSKAKAVQQIHSETQRMVRESCVSLPYHKPRQRSLVEFLQRRHASVPSAASLKMSSDNLGELWKELAQREKDAEQFYKSDSDDDCDRDTAVDRSVHSAVSSLDVASQVTTGVCSNAAAPSDKDNSTADSSGASATGVSASNNDVTSCVISSDTDVLPGCIQETGAGAVSSPSSGQVVVSNLEASECCEEGGAAVSVANNITSRQAADSDHDVISVQNLMPGDSCDFHLHYSESQTIDGGVSEVVTYSELHDDRSNAVDSCLEVVNTEDFALHYSESQHSLPGVEESQKQEKITCQESLPLPSTDGQGVNDSAEAVPPNRVRRSLPLQADITTLKPRLSAAPNGIVELDREEPNPSGVLKLMQRFMKHSAAKQPQEKHTIEVGVVSAEKDADGIEEVRRDAVRVVLGAEEPKHDPELAKPWARHQRLKGELQQQIAQRRSEEWSRRLQERQLDNEEEEQLSECGGLMDDLEAETTDTETESEEEEEDIVLVEKRRVKSAFLDDEAEVSDDEETSDGEDEAVEDMSHGESQAAGTMLESAVEGDEADVSDDGEASDGEDEAVEDMSHGESQTTGVTVKNILKEDEADVSDDSDASDGEDEAGEVVSCGLSEAAGATVKSTFEEDGVDVPGDDSEASKMSRASEQGIPHNSTGQKIDETLASTQQLSGDLEVTPTAPSRKSKLERAKTFDLFAATQEDGGDSDLEMIPPYQPPGAVRKYITPTIDRNTRILDFISPVSNLTSLRDSPSTQSQLLSPLTGQMCSATPAGVPKKLFTEPEPSNLQDNMDELLGLCSGQFTGNIGCLVDPVMETSRTGLEAELLGLCSGKFVSQPVNLHSLKQDEGQSQSTEDPAKHETLLFSTDDEEDEVMQSRTRKKHKKLDISDEESDLENDGSAEQPDISETKFVDYDSEENEVVDPSEPRGLAVSEFFEDEAELSESDWDSADEDEQDLDTLDFEEGDAEKLDQHKVKEQLDKIYMRHLLDKDSREVRMLKEILLEDGELHSEGGGRERKFRWKNINNVDDSELPHRDSDSEGVDEVENEDEELWRRMRHEREMFLQQQKVDDMLGDTSDSQLLKLGWAALKRTNSEDPTKRLPSIRQTTPDPMVSPNLKCPFKLVARRGSFLARGQNALARIAELTRGSTGGPVVGPKNSRNFVFATLSPEKVDGSSIETPSVEVKKRKQDMRVTPAIVKRLRISDQHSRGRRLLDLLS